MSTSHFILLLAPKALSSEWLQLMRALLLELQINSVELFQSIDESKHWVGEKRSLRLGGMAALLGTAGSLVRGVDWRALSAFASCHLPTNSNDF